MLTRTGAGAGTAVELTVVMQTMSYANSKCFKDTHPPFTVANQTVVYAVDEDLLARLRQREPGAGARAVT